MYLILAFDLPYLLSEAVVVKCTVQVYESQEMAHRCDHTLADMISTKVSRWVSREWCARKSSAARSIQQLHSNYGAPWKYICFQQDTFNSFACQYRS